MWQQMVTWRLSEIVFSLKGELHKMYKMHATLTYRSLYNNVAGMEMISFSLYFVFKVCQQMQQQMVVCRFMESYFSLN